MKIRDFFKHYGILENPFADEDAQTDSVFKNICIEKTFHPDWDKLYGNPADPSTAIVFGEKGSGKTALRMQMVRSLGEFNADHPQGRCFVVEYDDFNPFLDRFRYRQPRRRKINRVLGRWELWDHMDALLSLGVTQLVDRILYPDSAAHPAACDPEPLPLRNLNPRQCRDLLVLAAFYDQSREEDPVVRWKRLAGKLSFRTVRHFFQTQWDLILGVLWSLLAVFLFFRFGEGWKTFLASEMYLVILLGWLPRLWKLLIRSWNVWGVNRSVRVRAHSKSTLLKTLLRFPKSEIAGVPFPNQRSTDSRYELLAKLQQILGALHFKGMMVLVDRVDEPYLINGSPDLMRLLIWPLLDNKLLKHPGLGIKLLLPAQLMRYMEKENESFHQRARLDKQNVIRSLDWTASSLMDLANARMAACSEEGSSPKLHDFFDESVDTARLRSVVGSMKVPRHLFKFLYRLIITHTNAHPEEEPVWKIDAATFEAVHATYQRDREASERNLGIL